MNISFDELIHWTLMINWNENFLNLNFIKLESLIPYIIIDVIKEKL